LIRGIKKFLLRGYSKDNSLIRDSIILFSATMILNLTGFVFHFFMGRALGPSSYGVLGALWSLLYILIVPTVTIQNTLSKFTSELKAEKEYGKIKYLTTYTLKLFTLLAVLGLIFYLLLSKYIAAFLHIPLTPVIIFGAFFVFAILLPVSRGIIQGLQWFKTLGVNMSFEGFAKLAFGVILVLFGLEVNGAALSVFLAFLFSFLITYFPLRRLSKYKSEKYSLNGLYKYFIPMFIALLVLTSFYSIDVLLVKHFFDSVIAGKYAAMSLVGKTIFFATIAISYVMFPKVSELNKQKKYTKNLLIKSLLLVLAIGVPMTFIYSLFPELVINIFFGEEYLDIANILWRFSLFILFFSLTYTVVMYNLSIDKLKSLSLLFLFALAETALIWKYHGSLLQITNILMILGGGMFIILFLISLLRKNDA